MFVGDVDGLASSTTRDGEGISGAWMGSDGAETVGGFTAAFSPKNVSREPFGFCLGLFLACAFRSHSARQALEPWCISRFLEPAVPTWISRSQSVHLSLLFSVNSPLLLRVWHYHKAQISTIVQFYLAFFAIAWHDELKQREINQKLMLSCQVSMVSTRDVVLTVIHGIHLPNGG